MNTKRNIDKITGDDEMKDDTILISLTYLLDEMQVEELGRHKVKSPGTCSTAR